MILLVLVSSIDRSFQGFLGSEELCGEAMRKTRGYSLGLIFSKDRTKLNHTGVTDKRFFRVSLKHTRR